MKLKDLSENQQRVLTLINEAKEEGIKQGEICKRLASIPKRMPAGTVASSLNRMEAYGLIVKPEKPGKEWVISAEGMKLFDPVVSITPQKAREPVQDAQEERTQEETPIQQADESQQVIGISEQERKIDKALNGLRARLTGQLPPHAIRVYRQVLLLLPTELADALTSVTEMVEAHQ